MDHCLIYALQYKKARKTSTEPITPARRAFLTSLLEVLLQKLKWQEEDDPDDMDEDDKVAFEDMRKVGAIHTSPYERLYLQGDQELRTFVDAVTVIDQDLVTEAVHTIAMNTLTAYRNASPLKWNVAELAVYLVYSFGEINKSKCILQYFTCLLYMTDILGRW
jgi:exportin-T